MMLAGREVDGAGREGDWCWRWGLGEASLMRGEGLRTLDPQP